MKNANPLTKKKAPIREVDRIVTRDLLKKDAAPAAAPKTKISDPKKIRL